MRRARILLLEDDKTLRESLSEVLADEGYEVVAVGAGEAAVEVAVASQFDLLVADVRMKGMSGLDALEQVKGHQPDIGRMVITGYASEADSMRATRLGVGEYLKKPFRSEIFLSAIEKILADRRVRLNQVRRSQAFRGALLWTYHQWAEKVRPLLTPRDPGQVAQLAGNLARRMNFGTAAAEEVELATLVYLSRSQPGLECPPISELAWPEGVSSLLSQLEDRAPDAADPLSRPAACVASACARGHFPPPFSLEGVCPPDLLGGEASVGESCEHSDSPEEAQRRRNLLGLGQALWEGGDEAAGRHAFELLCQDARPSRERLEAELWLARVHRGRGETTAALERAERAAGCARHLRSESAASGLLEAALAMARLGSRQVREVLEEALSFCGSGASPTAALVRLALLRIGETAQRARLPEDLALLLASENRHELIHSSDWLLPLFLEKSAFQAEESLQRRALQAVASEQPALFEPFLGADQPEARRHLAVQSLAESGAPGALDLLRALQGDSDEWIRTYLARQAPPGAGALPTMRIFSLGGFDVYQGERRLAKWHSQKTRFLLAWLVSQVGQLLTDDAVIDAFWPDELEAGRANINVNCSHLRRMLKIPEAGEAQPQYVLRHEGGVRFNAELPRWHDLELLEQSLRGGAAAPPDGRIAHFTQVSRLYRGPYLEGCYLDFAVRKRDDLEERVIQALLELSSLQLQRRAYREALEAASQTLSRDACRQEAALLCMQSLLGLGQPEQALRTFESFRRTLDQELGLEPAEELEKLAVQARA